MTANRCQCCAEPVTTPIHVEHTLGGPLYWCAACHRRMTSTASATLRGAWRFGRGVRSARGRDVALRSLALCAGIGGLDLGVHHARPDHRVVGFVERQAYCAATLVARMGDASMEPAPIWDDLRTFDARAWAGCVDLVTAGFPCQPVSVAGKRAGTADERWLWPEVWRIVRDVRSRFLFVENVPGLLGLGLDGVLADLAASGWSAEWDCVSAASVGAPHLRDRFFLLAVAPDADGVHQRIASEPEPIGGGCNATAAHDDGEARAVAGRDAERGPWDWRDAPLASFRRISPKFPSRMDGVVDATKDEEVISALVSCMRRPHGTQALPELHRRHGAFSGAQDVLDVVRGVRNDEGGPNTRGVPGAGAQDAGEDVSALRHVGVAIDSPCGQELAQQRTIQFADAVHVVSHVLASRSWGHQEEAPESAMSYLLSAICEGGPVRDASAAEAEIWRPASDDEKHRWLVDTCSRVISDRDWADRIHSLGNAVVPLCAARAWSVLWGRLMEGQP